MDISADDLEMNRIIEASYSDDLHLFCGKFPRSFIERSEDMLIYSSGLPMPSVNGVFCRQVIPNEIEKMIDNGMSHFLRSNLPMCWTLSPSCSNVGLDKLLIKRGLVETDPATGMVTDLAEVERAPWPDGLEISLANDDKGMADFIRVTAEGFDIPDGLWGGWSALMLSNTGPEFNHFVGYLGGKPVSASMALHRGDIASFYNIVTLEDARGKGIGGAITRESMLHAKGKGIRTGILEASKMGLPVYERLGFRKVCEFRMFVWMHAMDQ